MGCGRGSKNVGVEWALEARRGAKAAVAAYDDKLIVAEAAMVRLLGFEE